MAQLSPIPTLASIPNCTCSGLDGPLFPYLASVRTADRATEFRSRRRQLGINGVTLHSYRYAWVERDARTIRTGGIGAK